MDKIELNGEIYVKESTMDKIDNKEILSLLEKSSIDSNDIAEVLKDKLSKELEDGNWIDKEDINNNRHNVKSIILYSILNNYY